VKFVLVKSQAILIALAGVVGLAMTPASAFSTQPVNTLFDFGVVEWGTTPTYDLTINVGLLPGESLTSMAPVVSTLGPFTFDPGPCQLAATGACTFTATFLTSVAPPFFAFDETFEFAFSGIATDAVGEFFGPVSGSVFARLQGADTIFGTPIPAAFPLFGSILAATGWLLGRRKRNTAAG